jgi:hypothetical protein
MATTKRLWYVIAEGLNAARRSHEIVMAGMVSWNLHTWQIYSTQTNTLPIAVGARVKAAPLSKKQARVRALCGVMQ